MVASGSGGSASILAGSNAPKAGATAGAAAGAMAGAGGRMMPPWTPMSDAAISPRGDGGVMRPFDASTRDSSLQDSGPPPDAGQCGGGTQRCVLPENGGGGICSETGECRGCVDNEECRRVYGNEYYLCATGSNCFLPV